MTGVEILATQEVATAFAFYWENFWIAFILVTLLGGFIGFIVFLSSEDFTCIVIGLIMGTVFGTLLGTGIAANSLPIEYETRYKVAISDEVQMNDFLEKYEIVSQEGKIYTVRERDGIEDGK